MLFNTIFKKGAILLLAAMFITVSCEEDLLEQTNPNVLTPDTFWQNGEDAKKAIVGAYSPFTDIWYYSRIEIFLSDYRDDVINGFATSARTNPGRFAGTSDQNMIQWVWRAVWKAISRTNEVLVNVPNIEMDQTEKDNILGEAYFLRALNYFNLVNNWLNIPLITEPITVEEAKEILQAPPADVWNQIVNDLKQAQNLLPASWEGENVGRATAGAATALLGKVYLYQQDYGQAKSELEKVMSSNTYQLATNYADNFSSFTENNEESIFEIQFTLDDNRAWGGDRSGIGRTNSFTPDIAPQGFTGQDGMRVNQWVLDLFLDERTVNGEVDPRAFNTLFWRTDETTTYQGEVLSATLYEGKTYQEAYEETENRIFGKKYLGIDEGLTTANFQSSPNNLRLIRYADVLLMFAEAEFMLNGSTQAALDAINEVRARVDMPAFATITMQDIEDERVKELTFERTRYFDLLRWGKVKERIVDTPDIKNESGGVGAYQEGREYLDLPQNELDNNPNFQHNPGYN